MKDLDKMTLNELKDFKKQIQSRISELSNKSYYYGEARLEKQSQYTQSSVFLNDPYYRLSYKTKTIGDQGLSVCFKGSYKSIGYASTITDSLTVIDEVIKDLEGLKDIIKKESK